jgi:dissimilatory sulfite reductase (desulfoviridin) alpha/beta subunit
MIPESDKRMKWTPEAEKAIKKVPFFVRKKVRLRVENEAKDKGKYRITLDDVKATKAAYLSNMSAEVKGYQVDACFGSEGCSNRATNSDFLIEKIEEIFRNEDLLGFLKERVSGDLKPHHEFRVTVADCPNACSQPQIKDIGIIGACIPEITDNECSLCNLCVDICREKAISIDNDFRRPVIDFDLCLNCGQCVDVCPTGTIQKGQTGYRVQLGGKLGRHPRLARELPGIYEEDQVIEIVKACIKFYKDNSKHGERFSEIFKAADFEGLLSHFTPHSTPPG